MSRTLGESEIAGGLSVWNQAKQEDDQKTVTSPAYMVKTNKKSTSPKEIFIPQNVNKKECVRMGRGITGLGTTHINPALSGRLTLAMLEKMASARKLDA